MEELEQQLDSFDSAQRMRALKTLCRKVEAGQITLPEPGTDVNMHCHTFFSYNAYGYSPTKFAWLARKAGLAVAGIVDFDVLDGLEEFLQAAKLINLKAVVGLETRVFVPEFSEREICSPGEPGIAYYMGVGFPTSKLGTQETEFLGRLRETAQQRNRQLIERINKYLKPVEIEYERDVTTLTPSGNPTERHICLAYARKANQTLNNTKALEEFWSEKLGAEVRAEHLPETRELLNIIRSRTMKSGGVGYVLPDRGSFPLLADASRFALQAGAIPTHTWLDGTSEGEKAIEELLRVAMNAGTAAINIIPHRNYRPGIKDEKLENLYRVVEIAEKLNLPMVVGTEMNSPGQRFVDTFSSDELSPLVPVFLKGAHIVYAHSVLQQKCGLGYTSRWAKSSFKNLQAKNEFFERLGRSLPPQKQDLLADLDDNVKPKEIISRLNH